MREEIVGMRGEIGDRELLDLRENRRSVSVRSSMSRGEREIT